MVVQIGHLNKSQSSKSLFRALGTIDIVTVIRRLTEIDRIGNGYISFSFIYLFFLSFFIRDMIGYKSRQIDRNCNCYGNCLRRAEKNSSYFSTVMEQKGRRKIMNFYLLDNRA